MSLSRGRDAGRRRGFTVTELLVGFAVGGLLAASAARVVVWQHRLSREQRARADAAATLRTADLVLSSELRRLGGDSLRPDLVSLGVNAIRYHAVRQWRFLCGRTGAELLLERPYLGMREIDPRADSLSVYIDRFRRWGFGGVRSIRPATCPDGSPGVGVTVSGLPGAFLSALERGAPVRVHELAELRAYRGGTGEWWIGMRRQVAGVWPSIQPLLGPIRAAGLEFTGFDAGGVATVVAGRVVTLRMRVTAPAPPGGGQAPGTVVVVQLRNRAP